MKCLPRRRMLPFAGTVVVLLTGLGASPAFANTSLIQSLINTPTSTSGCTAPSLFQPFASSGDTNAYMLLPGETPDNFSGAGWVLSGGAHIVATKVADGQTGSVLDLPSGSFAISPPICVTNGYTTARTEVRNVEGAEGVGFFVTYAGQKGWNTPQNSGQVHGQQTSWTLSDPVNVQPSSAPGWQLVRFGLVPGGKSSEFQIYDFDVDPRMTH